MNGRRDNHSENNLLKTDIINLVLKPNFYFRNFIAEVVQGIFVKPWTFIAPWKEKKFKEGEVEKSISVQGLDLEFRWHRTLHRLIKFGAKVTSLTDGVKDTSEIRGILMSSAPGTEFIGLRTGKTIRSIELLGRRYEDGSRGWDVLWVFQRVNIGKFRILDVRPEGESEMKAHCIWIDGKHAGRRFELATEQSFLFTKNELVPQYVFGQPTLTQFVILAGSLWAAVEQLEYKDKLLHFLKGIFDLF